MTTLGRYREILASLAEVTGVGRLLDVGCGNGDLLAVARDEGWDVVGVDPGGAAQDACREKGLIVKASTVSELEDDRSFDVITAVEVLEHLVHPAADVVTLASMIRPGGLMYITTPNFDSISRRLTGAEWRAIGYPEHLAYFTCRSLASLARRAGLEPLSVVTEGLSVASLAHRLRRNIDHRPGNALDESVRSASESSRPLALPKAAVNAVLRATRSGDTVKGTFRKPL